MRKAALFTLLTLAIAITALADERDRHQSYISYDDGGTIVHSGDDNREVEAHRNLPVYPGDEVVTARRGRAEVRLSDGNVIGIDRATALRFRSILDSYEGDANETVAELKYGKIAVYRTDLGRDHVRLDTQNASYVAEYEALYSVESDSRGNDRVTVFDGSDEVRTPNRSTRLRAGESATVDDRGAYDLVGDVRNSADDFERWFLRRSEKFNGRSTKYVDRRTSYWADDLDDYGRWVNVTGIGWSWRPYVAVGWRPYYHGYWAHRHGCLTWVSYDPWGWGTYHYGRWAFDPGYGWVWVPGIGYSPAWVYWWYGSGYIGWAPSGWWDCYRPYYNWAYQPYRGRDFFGFGFYGRVRIHDIDLRPWTFIDSNTIVSTRIDRAALTTDAIKQRLGRSQDGYATIVGGAARFTREEFNDPAAAIRRRGIDGRSTGRETGAPPADMTPFFRRDAEVGGAIRDRITRSRGGSGSGAVSGGVTTSPRTGGGLAPIDGGSLAPIGRGSVAPIDGSAGSSGVDNRRGSSGTVGTRDRLDRGSSPSQPRDGGGIDRGSSRDTSGGTTSGGNTSWRNRAGDRPETVTPEPSTSSSGSPTERSHSDSWRSRVRSEDSQPDSSSSDRSSTSSGSSDVPRRVIDRIGGARVYPRDSGDSGSSSTRERDSSSTRERDSSTTRERPRSDSSSRDRSTGSRDSGRSSSGSRDSGSRDSGRSSSSGSRDSGSRDSGSRSSGSRDSGSSSGRVQRDQ